VLTSSDVGKSKRRQASACQQSRTGEGGAAEHALPWPCRGSARVSRAASAYRLRDCVHLAATSRSPLGSRANPRSLPETSRVHRADVLRCRSASRPAGGWGSPPGGLRTVVRLWLPVALLPPCTRCRAVRARTARLYASQSRPRCTADIQQRALAVRALASPIPLAPSGYRGARRGLLTYRGRTCGCCAPAGRGGDRLRRRLRAAERRPGRGGRWLVDPDTRLATCSGTASGCCPT